MAKLSGCTGNADRLRSRGPVAKEATLWRRSPPPRPDESQHGRPYLCRLFRFWPRLVSADIRRTVRRPSQASSRTPFSAFCGASSSRRSSVGGGGSVGGYDEPQLVAYVWIGQGMLATVGLWGDTALATRIRTGEVVSDLLRPIHPIVVYLATDLGRAGFAVITRFVVPVAVGLIAFDFYRPAHAATYPLFAVSVLAAVVLSLGCRYIVNAVTLLAARRSGSADCLVAAGHAARRPVFPAAVPARPGGRDALAGHAVPVAAADAARHRGGTRLDRAGDRLHRRPAGMDRCDFHSGARRCSVAVSGSWSRRVGNLSFAAPTSPEGWRPYRSHARGAGPGPDQLSRIVRDRVRRQHLRDVAGPAHGDRAVPGDQDARRLRLPGRVPDVDDRGRRVRDRGPGRRQRGPAQRAAPARAARHACWSGRSGCSARFWRPTSSCAGSAGWCRAWSRSASPSASRTSGGRSRRSCCCVVTPVAGAVFFGVRLRHRRLGRLLVDRFQRVLERLHVRRARLHVVPDHGVRLDLPAPVRVRARLRVRLLLPDARDPAAGPTRSACRDGSGGRRRWSRRCRRRRGVGLADRRPPLSEHGVMRWQPSSRRRACARSSRSRRRPAASGANGTS